MTPQEFKSWFDGFTEAMDGVPSKKQWARIQGRVAEIDGKPVTERVFVDRYWPSLPYPYYHYGNVSMPVRVFAGAAIGPTVAGAPVFNSNAAMLTRGRADAVLAAA